MFVVAGLFFSLRRSVLLRRAIMHRRVASFFLLFVCAGGLLATGCERIADLTSSEETADTTRAPGVPPPGEGLVTTATDQSVQAVTQALKSVIQASPATLVADIDHAQNVAGSAGDSLGGLGPMRLLVFGNPQLGTPLMQSVSSTGIDLPQKILVWQGANDSTRITYNAPAYLQERHDLEGVSGPLGRMGGALFGLVEQAAGRAPDTLAFNADSIAGGAGLAFETSDFDVDETFRRLESAVQAAPQLSIMTRVDHAANAAGGDSLAQQRGNGVRPTEGTSALGVRPTEGTSALGVRPTEGTSALGVRPTEGTSALGVRPTRLLVFGNPSAGTPMMQQAPTMGIDLPQKMLVYEGDERKAFVAYNEPAYLARRHELADTTGLSRIAQTLADLAFKATADEEELQELREARTDSTGVAF
jgi:uncharacterized protein (DUF302 family)